MMAHTELSDQVGAGWGPTRIGETATRPSTLAGRAHPHATNRGSLIWIGTNEIWISGVVRLQFFLQSN
ncbi:hypothetical protein GUJ93_ZPchr0002g24446 [Zizania palustris]|uniref:Uncharacterized protein n=1 Tax=Zizania palustris TaxID=103762 RepID=A0A8J5RSZ0_ZIZPA|nr:hypothetical protein GUJ93_ZPchr0002g24446 [Zizania palustris]